MALTPARRWAPLSQSVYRVKYHGKTWLLEATPGARYPWLLYTGDRETASSGYVCQEIGMADVRQAQGMAEFWLDVTHNYPYSPTRNQPGTKHTGTR